MIDRCAFCPFYKSESSYGTEMIECCNKECEKKTKEAADEQSI